MNEANKVQQKMIGCLRGIELVVHSYLKEDGDKCEDSQRVCLIKAIRNLESAVRSVEDDDINPDRYPKEYVTDIELYPIYNETSDIGGLDMVAILEWRNGFYQATGEHIKLYSAVDAVEELGLDSSVLHDPNIVNVNLVIDCFYRDALQYLDNTYNLEDKLFELLTEHTYFNCLDSGIDYDRSDLENNLKSWNCNNEDITEILKAFDALK